MHTQRVGALTPTASMQALHTLLERPYPSIGIVRRHIRTMYPHLHANMRTRITYSIMRHIHDHDPVATENLQRCKN